MKNLRRLIVVAILLGFGYFAWYVFFPNPRQVITRRINKLAHLASFSASEGNITRLANVQKLGGLFSDNVQLVLDIPGYDHQTLNGRAELMQAAAIAKNYTGGLKVEFLDPNIELAAGNESALVDLTLKAKAGSDNDMIVQELKFTFKKIKGDWLITHIETVDTLKP